MDIVKTHEMDAATADRVFSLEKMQRPIDKFQHVKSMSEKKTIRSKNAQLLCGGGGACVEEANRSSLRRISGSSRKTFEELVKIIRQTDATI